MLIGGNAYKSFPFGRDFYRVVRLGSSRRGDVRGLKNALQRT